MYEPSLHIWVSGAKQKKTQVNGFLPALEQQKQKKSELMFEAAEVCWTYWVLQNLYTHVLTYLSTLSLMM